MTQELKAAWALLFGIGLMSLANGLQGTLLGLRASLEGFGTLTTGAVMAGYFIGMVLGSKISAGLIARVGHIKVFAALAALASIVILVQSVLVDPWVWGATRVLTGVCYAGLYVVSESWLNDRASNENRGALLSIYMLIISLGMGSGQFLLNIADPQTTQLFILVSVIVSFASVPILLTARPAPAFETSTDMSLVELYRHSSLAVQCAFLVGAAHGTIFGVGAVYGVKVGFTTEQLAAFMAAFSLGGLLGQWPIGRLSDLVVRREVMLWVGLAACLTALAADLVVPAGWLFLGLATLVGAFVLPMYSVSVAYVNDRLPAEKVVGATGAIVMASGLGLTLGPVLTALAMEFLGAKAFFASISVTFGLLVGFVLISKVQREASAEEIDSTAAPAPGMIGSPVAAFVSPDAEEYAIALEEDDLERLDEQAELLPDPPMAPLSEDELVQAQN